MKISVVINTYNADKHLSKVLESVKEFDEIIICDMESTDMTLQIAVQYGCRIIKFPHTKQNIVEPARQFAIGNAKYEWVLVVDADEIVPDALRKYLYEHIIKPNCSDGLYIPRQNYFMGRFMHCHYPDYILRFFRKSITKWAPVIHIQPEVLGKVDYIPSNRKDLAFVHLANDTISERIAKTNTYTDNELERKKNKTYGCLTLIYRPFHRFFKAYILKGGIRDGMPGFIKANLEGYYQFIMIAKYFEEKLSRSSIQK